MAKVETETVQMITALRDGLHGLHLARMALVGEARALRLAGRKAEREAVWSRVEEITAQIETTNRELAEHMLRSGEETQRRGDAEARWGELMPCPFCGAKAKTKQHEPSMPELPNGWWTVECSHATQYHHKRGKGCPVMPMAVGDTTDEAVKNWNTRAVPADEHVASRCYSKRPCNFAVTGEAGETIKDIRARLGTGKPARMPTLAAAEGAARWVSELTGRAFVAEEAQ